MENLLVNLAIIKVNSDKSSGILDNYIPVFAFCLKQISGEFATTSELQELFEKTTEIKIPQSVILSLTKRASKRYGYLEHTKDRTYKIKKGSLPTGEYEQIRNKEVRNFNALRESYIRYCRDALNISITQEDAESGFFETLYAFAPKLYRSVAKHSDAIQTTDRDKLLVAKFIHHCNQCDDAAIESIESFVRGAMLTEVFYYSDPDRVEASLRDIKVFFDTEFLIRALELCDEEASILSIELIEILRSMDTKMRCFRDTLNELDGILHAAQTARNHGRLRCKKPGDVFDYYSRKGASVSDIQMDRASLERKLKALGIFIEERPIHTRDLAIDELGLSAKLDEFLNQTEEARKHDIDCATAIHRLRKGQAQNYLESCSAIFVTTNHLLSRGITEFFKQEQGRSDVSICMSDQVFTTLVWIKAVKKKPLKPAKLIVANCIASLQPSQEDWTKYINEVSKLESQGDITEDDYYLLVHSNEARSMITEMQVDSNEHVIGNPKQMLERIKSNITHNLEITASRQKAKIDELSSTLQRIQGLINILFVFLGNALVFLLIFSIWLYANKEAGYAEAITAPASEPAAWAYFLFIWTFIGTFLQKKAFDQIKTISSRFSEGIMNHLNRPGPTSQRPT